MTHKGHHARSKTRTAATRCKAGGHPVEFVDQYDLRFDKPKHACCDEFLGSVPAAIRASAGASRLARAGCSSTEFARREQPVERDVFIPEELCSALFPIHNR
jgi:hypothetical protein